jgi:hypothetical protein
MRSTHIRNRVRDVFGSGAWRRSLDSSLREATCKSLMHRGNNGLICAATSVDTVNGVPWRSQRRLHYRPLKEAARTYFKMVIGELEVSLLRRAQRWLETEIPRKSRGISLGRILLPGAQELSARQRFDRLYLWIFQGE